MTLCFRSDEPTGGLGHTASRMLVTQLLVLGSFRSCIAWDFVVLVLSEAVLSPPWRTVLSATVLVLDGCLNCGAADRRSRGFAVTCGPMGPIAILDLFEYEYDRKHKQCGAPKSPTALS